MARILLVEDHETIREGVAAFLRGAGHEVEARGDGSDLISLADRFDLFILDVMLPGQNGFELAKELRSRTKAPFLFVTARASEADRLAGWELGAVDYVVKPFSPRELVFRIKSILSRQAVKQGPQAFVLENHQIFLELEDHRLWVDKIETVLTTGEWAFLQLFIERPGSVLSRKDLMSGALAYYVDTGARTVDTHVKNLRAKLASPAWIETVRGYGYRFAGIPTVVP